MLQFLARAYLHLIFSTKDHHPFLEKLGFRQEMHSYLGGVAKNFDCLPVEIGGVADHVHLLLVQARTVSIADLVKELKRVSTGWAKAQEGLGSFRWQAGYGAFSVSQSLVEKVARYIRNQEEHHRTKSFQVEYREFLRKHGVEFDERCVWE